MRPFVFCVLLALSCFSVNAQSSDYFGMISEDTLVAGEPNDVFLNVGYFDPSSLFIFISPAEPIFDGLCLNCNDTIKVTDYTIVNDTLLQATIIPPYGIYPGRFRLEIYNGIYYNQDENLWIVSKPYLVNTPDDVQVCRGEPVSVNLKFNQSNILNYDWYLGDDPLTEIAGSSLEIPSVTVSDTGTYTCIVSNDYGSITVEFNVDVYSFPVQTGTPSGPTALCQASDATMYSLPDNELIQDYTWRIQPDTAGTLNQDGSSLSVTWNEHFYGTAELFAETQLEQCGGENSDTLQVWITGPQYEPEICIVGKDEETGKYMVVWNKLDDASIVAYNIYRESNQTGVYLELGTRQTGDLSVFVDETSSPEVFSHSYRISYTDTCGNESEMSVPHNTIHLTANDGTGGENNLSWSPYTGFAFLTYDLYRGTDRNDLALFAQINSNVTSYSDFDPPAGRVYYQVVVERDGQCTPTKKALDYNRSSSNIAATGALGVEDETMPPVQVYPNPATGSFTVSLPGGSGLMGTMQIISMTGQQVGTVTLDEITKTVNTADWPEGIYTLVLNVGDRQTVQRLLILR